MIGLCCLACSCVFCAADMPGRLQNGNNCGILTSHMENLSLQEPSNRY